MCLHLLHTAQTPLHHHFNLLQTECEAGRLRWYVAQEAYGTPVTCRRDLTWAPHCTACVSPADEVTLSCYFLDFVRVFLFFPPVSCFEKAELARWSEGKLTLANTFQMLCTNVS